VSISANGIPGWAGGRLIILLTPSRDFAHLLLEVNRGSQHGERPKDGSYGGRRQHGACEMTKRFKVGDHVSWNSEAGRVSGTIIAVHTRDFNYKGHTHRASSDDPQYEIKSDKTDHIAAHKGNVLNKA
jgi:hypothetical protein